MQPHYRNIFKRRVSVDYLNDYNFSEAQITTLPDDVC